MKKFIITFSILFTVPAFSQIAIGESTTTAGSNVSLEFYDTSDNVKGIVLPWVSTVLNNPVTYNATTGEGYRGMQGAIADGTIIFNLPDKKVKYMKAGTWFDLTGSPTFLLVVKDVSNSDITFTQFNSINSSLQDNVREFDNAKSAIGINAATDTTNFGLNRF